MIRTMLSKGIRLASLTSPKLPCLRYFSPFSSSSSRLNSSSSNPNSSAYETNDIDDVPSDVSTQELKRRISRYLEGEDDAIPSIFEAILARKLSGKHDNSDDEIMEEFQSKKRENKNQHFPSNLDASDDNTDSDEDDTDSDEGDTDSDEHDTNLDDKDNDSGNELTLWLKEIQREQGREE